MLNNLRKCFLFLCVLCASCSLHAHSATPSHHVIIDTDGAIDDFRAITLFLAIHDIRVLAITSSSGSVHASSAAQKVSHLLADLHHEGIPVGQGQDAPIQLPPWNSFAEAVVWGSPSSHRVQPPMSAQDLLIQTVESYRRPITLVALGSLTNYAEFLQNNPHLHANIDRIVWYNSFPLESGFNYTIDSAAYHTIVQTQIPLFCVSLTRDDVYYSPEFEQLLMQSVSVYAQKIVATHQQTVVQNRRKHHPLLLWDDLVPLFITNPILFTPTSHGTVAEVSLHAAIPVPIIHSAIQKLLESYATIEQSMFMQFPHTAESYQPRIREFFDTTYQTYGPAEWRAVVLTNKIHGHIGVYSIIGTKMGMRALDYFNVGVNAVFATSYAGIKPPLSCFNDGIQISTGATIGQGLLAVSDTVLTFPTVAFTANNHTVYMQVKPEIAKQMQADIRYGVQTYGLLSPKYWEYIEDLAYRYWADFDRREIFTISVNRKDFFE